MAARKKGASRRKQKIDVRELQGFKYFKTLCCLFDRLRDHATERDKAGNRTLYFDQYALLILFYYFNPTIDSLRGIQEFSTLEKVQRVLGVKKTSLGSLSEAANVFDPQLLEEIVSELAERVKKAPHAMPSAHQAALEGLTAVDGSLLKAVPRMAWALWQDDQHRAIKLHTAFSVEKRVPTKVRVTHGSASERQEFRELVEPGGFYVADRGYAEYDMFRDLDEAGCKFVIRVQENAVYEINSENELTSAALKAGVVKDVILKRLGTEKHNSLLKRPLRLLVVEGETPDQRWVLVTNQLEMPADLIVIAYRYRWQIELFFRWLKCVLGCRHLISESQQGVTIQVYLAIIASLMMGMWLEIKPTKRTYEMFCHYFSGWATIEELESYLVKQKRMQKPKPP